MKKLRSFIFLSFVLFSLLLSACGADDIAISLPLEPLRATAGDALGREHFLYDIIYFENILKNYFAALEWAYWHGGVNLQGLLGDMRSEILDAPSGFNVDGFQRLLNDTFAPYNSENPNFATHAVATLSFANFSIKEYREATPLSASPSMLRLFDNHPHLLDEFTENYLGTTPPCCHSRVALEFLMRNLGALALLHNSEFLHAGNVAYLALPHFAEIPLQLSQLEDFFNQAKSQSSHLILDIRGNNGHHLYYFLHYIVQTLISQPKSAYAFYFTHNLENLHRAFGLRVPTPIPQTDSNFVPVASILAEHQLPQRNQMEFAQLTYGLTTRMAIEPLGNFGFNGIIWLLVDEATSYDGQIAAWLAKEAGFATVVGETTGGHHGGGHMRHMLPNTNFFIYFDALYATDAHGRPMDAGTIPQQPNLPGLDALETVLYLIS